MRNVRSIFRRVISEKSAEAKPIDLAIFSDQRRATKALADLAQASVSFHIAPRTRQIFRKLRPPLLDWLAKAADPDATLNQFVRFVQAYGLRSLLFELLVTNPRLLELLVKMFDASQFAGNLLIRRPQLLDEITRSENLDRGIAIEEHLRRLASLDLTRASLDGVRAYRQTELLRIVLRDVLGLVDLAELLAEHSALAEACLLFVNRLLGSEELTIIALGKFGGREINYGADLDVLFVGEDIRAAQNLTVAMAQASAEGNIATLDTRLRPDGEKGPLVCSLAAYESYYRQRAQLWEIHALTRARPIGGPLKDDYIDIVQKIWREVGEQGDLFAKIDNMLERIRRERGSGSEFLNFKTGSGRMIEAEFLVQALQMKSGTWDPNWRGALGRLRENDVVSGPDASSAATSYELLRRVEMALRRLEK